MTWTATMISADDDFAGAPLLRREFALDEGHGAVTRATLRLTALGVVEGWLNGEPLSHHLLTPGWSSYEWRLRYAEFDVAGMLGAASDSSSVLGLALGNGWYRGRLTWSGANALYGDELGAFAQLEIVFDDGHEQVVTTDDGWRAGASATLANDLYDGQTIDARLRDDAWLSAGFDDSAWTSVHALEFDTGILTPYIGPMVSVQQELAPERIWTSPAGKTLVDFGQNLVGWVRVRVSGADGDTVTLRHAEVLENDELGTRPLRSALATDAFVLSGGDDVFEPTLTFHGFRYVEIDGWPGGEPAASDLMAVVVGSDLASIGSFECSDELLTKFHENVVWGMRGNFVDVPTDCPQRDERLGWTGDIAAFAPTAAFLADVGPFLHDWLRDLDAEQSHQDGVIPYVVPDVLKTVETPIDFGNIDSTALWSDAGVWVPWALWQAYGDRQVLEDQFDSMTAHVRRVRSLLSPSGVWDQGFQFADWLDPDAPPENPADAKADKGVVATACIARSARLVVEAASVLGRSDEVAEFSEFADDLRAAFNREYVHDGVVTSDCTTVYALAIAFDLLDEADRAKGGDRLAELVAESGYRISTGFAGTPFVTDALTDTGHLDEAYRLLQQRECPSWLYPVTMGATTVWERWDSMLPDGSINPGQMTSFNHYALGAVADWMHRTVAGISPLEPGYAKVLIAPQPGGDLTWAKASLESPHGRIAVSWRLDDGRLTVETEIPSGVTATLRLPGEADRDLATGAQTAETALTPAS